MELEMINSLIKLIGDNGFTIVASAILLYFTSKYFKENAENQKEIIQAIVLVKEKLVNGYINNDDLKLYVRVHWVRLCETYKSEILYYLIRNNISKNIDNIDNEIDKKINELINRIKELLRGQTAGTNLLKISDLLVNEYNNIHNIVISVLKETISLKENGENFTTEELARCVINHIEHIRVEVLDKIDSMNL